MKAFVPRWEGVRKHAFEVLEAMPEDQFEYQPVADVMTFSQLFSHMGKSLDIYAGMLVGIAQEEETESSTKGEVLKFLIGSFDRFENVLSELNSKNLLR